MGGPHKLDMLLVDPNLNNLTSRLLKAGQYVTVDALGNRGMTVEE